MWWFASSLALAHPLCQTPRLQRASPEEQAARILRPTAVGFVDSAILPLRVHFRRAQDEDRARDLVLPAAELSWQRQVGDMGWPAPYPDGTAGGDGRYDLYLTDEGTYGGAYTWGASPDYDPTDGLNSRQTFIALDDRFIRDADMLVFVAHEFNHALQYTIDVAEKPLVPWEGTAETIADLVDDASDAYLYEVPDFQRLPFASLLFDGYMSQVTDYQPWSYYEYGSLVFTNYVDERFGAHDGTKLRDMWLNLAQEGRADEPDWLDSLGMLDPALPDAAAVYTEFSVWRMFAGPLDDGAHFEEGGLWYDAIPTVEAELLLADLDGLSLTPTVLPYELGASYWSIDLQGGTTDHLRLSVDGDPTTRWGLAWAVWPTAGGPALTGYTLATGATAEAVLPLAGGERAMFGVVNGGRAGLEAEIDPDDVTRSSFTLTLAREVPPPLHTGDTGVLAPPTGDTGDTDPPPDTGDVGHTGEDTGEAPPDTDEDPATTDGATSCGCASPGGAGSAWLIGSALALARRRRRAA